MMRSIFSNLECRTGWEQLKNSTPMQEPLVFEEVELSYLNESRLKTSKFQISKTHITKVNRNKTPKKALLLALTLFEPFIEVRPSGVCYGFYLNSEIFYTSTQEDLEKCIILLKFSCILTNFEEEFVLLKRIGKGSTSIVYLCESLDRSEQYSVKKVEKKTLLKNQSVLNLAGEIQVYRVVDHPNICKLFFVYEDSEFVYLVLEYFPFGTLLERVSEKNTFTEIEAMLFTKKLLETLEYMHFLNVVHRDLKLENILMTGKENHEFKLIDLGLAYQSQFLQNKKCGSPGYVAPEILREEEYDYKIDIFGAGVILYILLHGKHPFEARSLKKMLNKNLECELKISKKISQDSLEVLQLMTEPLQEYRGSSSQLLSHPWFNNSKQPLQPSTSLIPTLTSSISVIGNLPS